MKGHHKNSEETSQSGALSTFSGMQGLNSYTSQALFCTSTSWTSTRRCVLLNKVVSQEGPRHENRALRIKMRWREVLEQLQSWPVGSQPPRSEQADEGPRRELELIDYWMHMIMWRIESVCVRACVRVVGLERVEIYQGCSEELVIVT